MNTTGITRTEFYADPNCELKPAQQAAYEAAIARRLKSEPIQYIIGEQEFYGLTLRVTPAVLIPRPETEHLIEAVLADLKSVAPARILDIGTGSGAIAIALAHHLPNAHVTATDISPAAVAIAKENATRHNLADRIQFLQSDLLDSLSEEPYSEDAAATRETRRERYDVIVSNPPYVPESDRATLHPQVRDYEPASALFAGDDGLDIYRRLIPQACTALRPGGLLAMEIGFTQRDSLAALLEAWRDVRFLDDYAGIARVVLATRP